MTDGGAALDDVSRPSGEFGELRQKDCAPLAVVQEGSLNGKVLDVAVAIGLFVGALGLLWLSAALAPWLALPGAATLLLTLLASASARVLRSTERLDHFAAAPSSPSVSVADVGLGAGAERAVVAQLLRRRRVGSGLSAALLHSFFAAVGASARLETVAAAGPALLVFVGLTLVVHCAVAAVGAVVVNALAAALGQCPAGKAPAISLDEVLVASNACVGGPATAAGFAGLIGRPDLVGAAAAWGTVGYACATSLGISLYSFLLEGK